MIIYFSRCLVKMAAYFVFWVLLLSIRWEGRTLFDHSHELLAKSQVMQAAEEQVQQLWDMGYEQLQLKISEYMTKEPEEKHL